MRDESAERLHSIRDELLAVQAKDFWEISDRGGNFDYLPPERKEMLRIFFGWFRDVSGELKAVSLDSPSAGRPLRPTGEQKGSSETMNRLAYAFGLLSVCLIACRGGGDPGPGPLTRHLREQDIAAIPHE